MTQLAACFAIDYLSWDEDDPGRRDQALRSYAPVGADPTRGWSGRGRQRASFAVLGATSPDDHDNALSWVDVRVLVTPYHRQSAETTPTPDAGPAEMASYPSCAPAPETPGWRALDSDWIALSVPVRRLSSGRLAIDTDPPAGPDTEAPRTDTQGSCADLDTNDRQGA